MQNSHTLQLQSSLFIPQFRTGCGFMPQGDTFYLLKKDTKRLQPKAVNLNSATTPLLLIFDKLFNLSATVFSICKISIRNNPSLLLHCFWRPAGQALQSLLWHRRSCLLQIYGCSNERARKFLTFLNVCKALLKGAW